LPSGFGIYYVADRATKERSNSVLFVQLPVVVAVFIVLFSFAKHVGFWSGLVLLVVAAGLVMFILEMVALRGARRVSKAEWQRCTEQRDRR
jgi:hypothetical protein